MSPGNYNLPPKEFERLTELFQKLIIWRDEEKLKDIEAEAARLRLQISQAKSSNPLGRPSEIENAKSVVCVENEK